MHPYITEQIGAERVKALHETAAAERLARKARRLPGHRRGSYLSGKAGRLLHHPSRPATA